MSANDLAAFAQVVQRARYMVTDGLIAGGYCRSASDIVDALLAAHRKLVLAQARGAVEKCERMEPDESAEGRPVMVPHEHGEFISYRAAHDALLGDAP